MGAATVGGGGCNRRWWRLQPYVMGRTGWDGAAHQNASRRLWLCFVWLCTSYGYVLCMAILRMAILRMAILRMAILTRSVPESVEKALKRLCIRSA